MMHKRGILTGMFFIAAALFLAGFCILLREDYTVYYPYSSAPFYVYVIERAIERLIPAVLSLTAGLFLMRRRGGRG